MKRITILIILCTLSLSLFSQKIEFYGGLNKNIFYGDNGYGWSEINYTNKIGYSFGLAIEEVKIDWITCRFTLNLDSYSGSVLWDYVDKTSSQDLYLETEKKIISLGIYPLNLNVFNTIDLNFGVEFSKLISEEFNGVVIYNHSPTYSHSKTIIEDTYDTYNSDFYFGFKSKIAYNITLSEKLELSPQYLYYFSFSKEFEVSPDFTSSLRHYFILGLKMKI